MVNWGDHSDREGDDHHGDSDLKIVNNGDGTFSVVGSHTYKGDSIGGESEGTATITVTIYHEHTKPQVVTTTASLSDPAVVAKGGKSLTAVEGKTSDSQVVATFVDPGGVEETSDYSATIDWGDGTAPTGADKIKFKDGVFNVYGSHKYAEESGDEHAGSNPYYTISVVIHHEGALLDSNLVSSSATVADAPLSAAGKNITGVKGVSTPVVTVAVFTDLGGSEPIGDYSATINWGGAGTGSTTGTIKDNGDGTFSVQGSFNYTSDGTYKIIVTITHEHGIMATTTGKATIKRSK